MFLVRTKVNNNMLLSGCLSSICRGCQSPLRSLGLQLELPQTGAPRVLVGKVPLCFTEKEHNEVRRGRPSVIKPVVEVSAAEPPANAKQRLGYSR